MIVRRSKYGAKICLKSRVHGGEKKRAIGMKSTQYSVSANPVAEQLKSHDFSRARFVFPRFFKGADCIAFFTSDSQKKTRIT